MVNRGAGQARRRVFFFFFAVRRASATAAASSRIAAAGREGGGGSGLPGCGGRRSGSDKAARVASSPGASDAEVSVRRARDKSPDLGARARTQLRRRGQLRGAHARLKGARSVQQRLPGRSCAGGACSGRSTGTGEGVGTQLPPLRPAAGVLLAATPRRSAGAPGAAAAGAGGSRNEFAWRSSAEANRNPPVRAPRSKRFLLTCRGGFVALGTPIGAPEYVAACARERLEQEQGLLAELPQLPDLQCAWLLLLFCAAPRAQHLLRTVPPSQSAAYAEAHDHAVWGTLQALLSERLAGCPPPCFQGGLGLLCATRAAPAAYWAAWADSLPVMLQRRLDAAERCVRELLVDDEAAAPCLREAAVAGDLLRRHWAERLSWRDILARAAPPAVADDNHAAPGAHARRLAQAPAPRAAPHAPVLRRRWVPGVRRRARCLGRPCGSVPAQRTVRPPRPLA